MARIMAIDFGTKRTGLAVTDPLQIIANGLDTIATGEVLDFIEQYTQEEEVSTFVVGEPMHLDGNPSQIAPQVNAFIQQLQKRFPAIAVHRQDERFTSVEAKQIILKSGLKKKKRRDKALVDKVSAVLILQDYLEKNRTANS
ncbi:MAG: Holliday junction resolvase RuvX [Bacteroidota bacterium]